MARGKKTGGRNFPRGNPGRPMGAKDKVSRKSIREMFENVLARSGGIVEAGIDTRLKRGDVRLLELVAAYIDGKPIQRVSLEPPQAITFLLQPLTEEGRDPDAPRPQP